VWLQEDFLFNGSILENITLGNPDITAEQVVEAETAAHDFISELPQRNQCRREAPLYLVGSGNALPSSSVPLKHRF